MRLITWNIQWGRGCDGRVDLARIAREIAASGDFDLICLQEVAVNFAGLPGSAGEDQASLLAAAFPRHQAFYGAASDLPAAGGGRARFGNLILSRLPVLQVFRHLLPWPADAAVPSMQRGCTEAVVSCGASTLRVMTTHLEYYSRAQRSAQVQALRALHREASAQALAPPASKDANPVFAPPPRGVAAILCGDFNFPPGDADHAALCADFGDGTPALCDAWVVAHPAQPHAHTVGLHGAEWPDHPYCCDFVFVTRNIAAAVQRVEVNAATDASDHQPLLIELDLP